jgi:hypothetical protein
MDLMRKVERKKEKAVKNVYYNITVIEGLCGGGEGKENDGGETMLKYIGSTYDDGTRQSTESCCNR